MLPSHIQQGMMLIAAILNADPKIPILTLFSAKFNLEWQEKHMINSYQPFQ